MAETVVSIVTPAYNHEPYIGQCIESVLAQTFESWEMLIVDDGSKDKTVQVVESYADPRIRLFRQENRGLALLAETYNLAVSNARGSLIAILEGDDYWPIRKLEIQVPDFRDQRVVLSWGLAVQVSEQETPLMVGPAAAPPWEARVNIPTGRSAFYMMSPSWQTFTFASTVMIRKETLDSIGGFQQPNYADYVDLPTFMTLALQGSWTFHDDVLGYWRRHTLSTTRNRYPLMLNAAYRWCADFAEKYGDRIPASACERDKVDLDWNSSVKDRLLAMGRKRAAEKKFDEARQFFRHALNLRVGTRTRRAARTAIELCRLGQSPEVAFRFDPQPDWRRMLVAPSGDPLVNDDMKPEDFARYDLLNRLP